MARRFLYLALVATLAVSGCAAGVAGSVASSSAVLRLIAEGDESDTSDSQIEARTIPQPPEEPEGDFVAIGDEPVAANGLARAGSDDVAPDEATDSEGPEAEQGEGADRQEFAGPDEIEENFEHIESTETYISTSDETDEPQPDDGARPATLVRVVEAQPAQEPTAVVQESPFEDDPGQEPEIVVTPEAEASPYKLGPGEENFDRFKRTIVDVEVDIRPSEGDLPESMSAPVFAQQPVIDESLPDGRPPELFCEYTPWTICFRPLYFEDIALERYGCNVGCLQSGLSGARFFVSVAALPYKMTRRPPRSCQCSNGFSRCGDCPLPCYGQRKFQWDAALVETAIVTGFVFLIP